MTEKVFCGECRYFEGLYEYDPSVAPVGSRMVDIKYPRCLNPITMTERSDYVKKWKRYSFAEDNNMNNDCPNFEEREPVKPIILGEDNDLHIFGWFSRWWAGWRQMA